MNRTNERGIALVITLFLMASLSALAVSLMFLSQTETSASRNYKTMSQARYAGEAGVHKAMNYLMSIDTATWATAYGSFTPGTSPVQYSGHDVVLSTVAADTYFPDTAVKTAFASAAQGTLAASTASLNYTAAAKLLSIRQVNKYGGGVDYIQTWQITATGTVPGALPATVEVTAVLERDTQASQTYAIFATGTGCGAIDLGGTSKTNSYDSRTMTTTPPTTTDSGGGVGTNGNLSISGHVTVNGNLDTPRTGVGACNDGSPTALTSGGSATVTGSIVPLPQARSYPTPPAPSPTPPTTAQTISASGPSCTAITAANPLAFCTVSGSNVTITSNGGVPLQLGNVTIGSHVNVTIQYGFAGVPQVGTATVNINSLTLGAQAQLNIGTTSSVVMNVAGTGVTTAVDFSGGAFANMSYDPAKFTVLYGGTGAVELIGGGGAAIAVYAPNAAVRLNGGEDIYGSVLSRTYKNGGNGSVHYDTALSSKFITMGNYMMSSFSWKKY